MPAGPNSVNQGKESGTRKRGGKLSGNRSHQGSAAHIGVRPAWQHQRHQVEAGSIRLSAVPHTWVCGPHGFYTKNFSLAERRGLEATKEIVLADEIALLRVLIRRFSDQILASHGVTLNNSAQHLAVVSEAMLRLASLLRTNHMLGGSESSTLAKELNLVLAEISAETAHDEG